jgi:transcription-repair coupling factor (superfamily II helicase)
MSRAGFAGPLAANCGLPIGGPGEGNNKSAVSHLAACSRGLLGPARGAEVLAMVVMMGELRPWLERLPRTDRGGSGAGYDSGSVTPPLAPLLESWPVDAIPAIPGRVAVPPALRAVSVAGESSRHGGTLLAIVPSERDAEELVDDLALFTDGAMLLPAWGTLPFEHISPNVSTMAARTAARHALITAAEGTIVVASVRAAIQRVSPTRTSPVVVKTGDEHDFDGLVGELVSIGYTRTDRVETRGELAVRGGIIDIAPAQGAPPVRLEFWGDEVAEIRTFSTRSQRSTDLVEQVVAFPAREVMPDAAMRERAAALAHEESWAAATWDRIADGITFPGVESWLPWIAHERTVLDEAVGAMLFVFDRNQCLARSDDLVREEEDLAAALAPTWGLGAPAAGEHPLLYLALRERLDDLPHLDAPPSPLGPDEPALAMRGLDAVPGDADSVAGAVARWQSKGIDIVIAMDGDAAATRVSRLLGEAGYAIPKLDTLDELRPAVLPVGIHRGFVADWLGYGVVGEQEVAGRRRAHRRPGHRTTSTAGDAYRDLRPGDFVVHHHHGIGRFEGLVHREIAGVERDYLLVAYYGEDKLYVPTDQLAAVRRYTGGETPRLSRMGGADWDTTRSKVRKAVAIVAEQVVDLHRKRAAASGHAFESDSPWQREFEAAFPYEETRDQLAAIADVKLDMEKPEPMDRLIFGDVGFGKTEVGLRAVFKAVQGGRQAAMLVPTTLLAQQHHATFEERLAPFPVRVEVLSRFLTTAQQREVIRGLASGDVDVVIGTHRLLSEDVEFADLGLLIVDEEQRFGVAAKDRLKRLRTSVDVLTLTATPIPRTLEMALTGIRDVSNIRTPPEDRHPILTYVGAYDDQAVSAAIRRELLREGQVFYVHNRVQSIDHAVERLRRLVPDARYAIAHGQMSEGQLEQVMYEFWNREHDVLVATTIIESGLDLPQVNTLIVERAERLGLAQLYQLRGRVGRSSQRAYAYLFHPPEERLAETAYRRLEAIGEFADLGSGFELAMRDLEIRGAGSILSETQAGHIAAVGFDMYVELVADAVSELKGDAVDESEPPSVRIDLPVDAHLPDDYVPGADQRLEAYRRMAAATTVEEVEDVAAEWQDRFGDLPPRAAALVDVAMLRVEAIRIGLDEVVKVRNEIRLAPVELKTSQEVRLGRLAPRAVLRGSVLFIPAPRKDPVPRLLEFLRTMWPPAEE